MEGVDQAEGFAREVIGSFLVWHKSYAECQIVSLQKRGADGSWQMQNVVRQNGTDGRWQHQTPDKEEFEFLRHSTDLSFEGVLMRQAYYAEKSSVWASCLDKFQKTDGLRRFIMVNHHEAVHGVEEC